MTDPLCTSLWDTIRTHDLFDPGERLLVGCSGGADSLTLVHALHALAVRASWRLEVAYVHHGLRPEADQEAPELAALLATWGLKLHVRRIDVRARQAQGFSPEEAARDLRYEALNRLASELGATALVMGHHADDQIETVLWRLTKGSALPGLLGIPMVRDQEAGPRIVRPLLETSRSAIEAYLKRHDLRWFEDVTNRDLSIPRNRLRHEVVPTLRALNPVLERTLTDNLQVLADEDAFVAHAAAEAFAPLMRVEAPALLGWDQAGFRALAPALQRRILATAYARVRGGRRGLSSDRIARMLHLFTTGGGPWDIGSGLGAIAQHGLLALWGPWTPPDPAPARPDGRLVEPWGVLLMAGAAGEISPGPDKVCFDPAELPADLVWRAARPGTDRFTPWGHRSAHTLERFLAKARIPRPLRDRLPVLASGDEVLWVVGVGRSAQAPVKPASHAVVWGVLERRAWFDKA